jgi:phenylalanine ammonia-lyase
MTDQRALVVSPLDLYPANAPQTDGRPAAGVETEQTSESEVGSVVVLTGHTLTAEQLQRIADRRAEVVLSERAEVRAAVDRSVAWVVDATSRGETIYGVTTGFGGMSHRSVPVEDAALLQRSLLAFMHAGSGGELPEREVRAAMAIRANSLLHGVSGARWELIERFAIFLNAGVTPVVRALGSIGASGDLAPLASIASAVTGCQADGQHVTWRGSRVLATDAQQAMALEPIDLGPKEGLALINGTSVSTASAALLVREAEAYLEAALAFHALAIQALGAAVEPFDKFVHRHKPHPGQLAVAATLRRLLAGSQLIGVPHRERAGTEGTLVQDRYAVRCMPQFLGPACEALTFVRRQLECEMNAATDNPLIDCAAGIALNAGNFLAEHVATGLDCIRAHVALIAKHVDVQVAQMMAPEFSGGLPPCLVGNVARHTNSGLKGLQICGNSIMPLVTYYSAPIADRFPTHAEQYNQNVNAQSMGAVALTRDQLRLAHNHLAVALLAAVQAVDLRSRLAHGSCDPRTALSPCTLTIYEAIRETLGRPCHTDRPLFFDDIDQHLETFVDLVGTGLRGSGRISRAVREAAWLEPQIA